MSMEFTIEMQWERLSEGSAEERACFGMLCFRHRDIAMTEGIDGYVGCSRPGPLVSGYPLAEWLAWNWWRLTVEPRREHSTSDWAFAHRLSTVGEGYLWPNITIFSDRERTALIAEPTRPQGFAAFRFATNHILVLPSRVFEAAVEGFLGQIQGRLREGAIPETNFDRVWAEVRAERLNPNTAARRRIEALLGVDPDEGNSEQVEQLLADTSSLGSEAVQELAAHQIPGKNAPTAIEIADLARSHGFDFDSRNRIPLDLSGLPSCEQPAWTRGYQAADALRKRHKLGNGPLNNLQLAELCGVSETVFQTKDTIHDPGLSFCLKNHNDCNGRILLRSKWETNRRFNLARLLGDQLLHEYGEPLSPATDAYTYRQKLQRAFAAELLCPFLALEDRLEGDYSAEARDDAAEYFKVSERTVTTLLVNHKKLSRDFLEDEAA